MTMTDKRERPILFSAPMVRAILDGRKTQTRRAVKNLPGNVADFFKPYRIVAGDGHSGFGGYVFSEEYPDEGSEHFPCPYGQPGDRLWVRETWKATGLLAFHKPSETRACGRFAYRADNEQRERDRLIRWRPSIFMPRWASRILLEITDVRVERLQDISDGDCMAEGSAVGIMHARAWYRSLWNDINGAGAWDANPWVWAISFKTSPAPRW